MSYCVNCGVELDVSAEKCVLCNTPVVNPNAPVNEEAPAPFSDTVINIETVKAKFVASMLSVILFIPNIVCFLVNVALRQSGFWAAYVNVSSIIVWVMFILPFLLKKRRPILLWAFDTVSAAIYIYVFYALQSLSTHWYFELALPITLATSLCVLIFMQWVRRKKRHWTAILIHLFSDITAVSVFIGTLLALYLQSNLALSVCIIIAACSTALVGFFIYCNRSKRIRAFLAKKFFV